MTTLLLVEDDARTREALRLVLADEGHRVNVAATDEQALDQPAGDPGRRTARPHARYGRVPNPRAT